MRFEYKYDGVIYYKNLSIPPELQKTAKNTIEYELNCKLLTKTEKNKKLFLESLFTYKFDTKQYKRDLADRRAYSGHKTDDLVGLVVLGFSTALAYILPAVLISATYSIPFWLFFTADVTSAVISTIFVGFGVVGLFAMIALAAKDLNDRFVCHKKARHDRSTVIHRVDNSTAISYNEFITRINHEAPPLSAPPYSAPTLPGYMSLNSNKDSQIGLPLSSTPPSSLSRFF